MTAAVGTCAQGRVCRGGWGTPHHSSASLDLLKFHFHLLEGHLHIFLPSHIEYTSVQIQLSVEVNCPPPPGIPGGLELRIHNSLNGILKIPICLAGPINKCEPFLPNSVQETHHHVGLRQA